MSRVRLFQLLPYSFVHSSQPRPHATYPTPQTTQQFGTNPTPGPVRRGGPEPSCSPVATPMSKRYVILNSSQISTYFVREQFLFQASVLEVNDILCAIVHLCVVVDRIRLVVYLMKAASIDRGVTSEWTPPHFNTRSI